MLGERKREAASTVSIPRCSNSRASVLVPSWFLQPGKETSSAARACTRSGWDCLRFQRTADLDYFTLAPPMINKRKCLRLTWRELKRILIVARSDDSKSLEVFLDEAGTQVDVELDQR